MIKMTQNIRQKILRNHVMLILLLNLLQITALLFTISWPPWYKDESSNDENVSYGLLLYTEGRKVKMNGFYD